MPLDNMNSIIIHSSDWKDYIVEANGKFYLEWYGRGDHPFATLITNIETNTLEDMEKAVKQANDRYDEAVRTYKPGDYIKGMIITPRKTKKIYEEMFSTQRAKSEND